MSQVLDPSGVQAIIFDIGNVLIDIDYDIMVSEFRKIAKYDFREIINYTHQESFFDLFEKGKISVADFRKTLKLYLNEGVTDDQIDRAWNSILIHYPTQKFDRLRQLKEKFNVYALSNINQIHADEIDRYMKETFGVPDMRHYFDQAYYSHEMGFRKPEKEIYQAVLDQAHLDPAQTLFIDDKAENTEMAASLGIQVFHLTDRDSLLDVLSSF